MVMTRIPGNPPTTPSGRETARREDPSRRTAGAGLYVRHPGTEGWNLIRSPIGAPSPWFTSAIDEGRREAVAASFIQPLHRSPGFPIHRLNKPPILTAFTL